MAQTKRIKRALVSVFHKDGLDEILRTLHAQGVELLSTGGTQTFIESLGIPCVKVEDVNRLLKSFDQMKAMIKQFSGPGMGKKMKRMGKFGGFGGFPGF